MTSNNNIAKKGEKDSKVDSGGQGPGDRAGISDVLCDN